MDSQKRNEAYKIIVNNMGVETQLLQTMEEAAELIAAISHHIRKRENSIDNLFEEIAHVEIMLEQLRLIFKNENIDNIIQKIKTDKLTSFIKRFERIDS